MDEQYLLYDWGPWKKSPISHFVDNNNQRYIIIHMAISNLLNFTTNL